MTSSLSALRSELARLAAAQQAAQRATFNGGLMDRRSLQQQRASMRDFRNEIIDTATASGAFNARSVNLANEVDRFNEALANNKLRMRDVVREMRDYRGENALWRRSMREQIALQNSVAADWGTDTRGRRMATLFVPRELPGELETVRARYQYINRMISSAADNTIKWGKNTQWAGRQLMVGFTYPLALVGAGTAALAYQYESEMARIIKVSDESSAQIRSDATETAKFVASEYGKSANDTLKVISELAAVGYEGPDLQSMTKTTQRGAFLGELDPETALKTTTTLQTVYKMNNKQLEEAYNYINAIENATSLTADDFTKSIPRVAALAKSLGVGLKELGVLMVGFKSAGVDPEEGARSLRATMFRTIAPRGHVLDTFKEHTGKDLKSIVEEYKGEFLPTFIRISEEIKGLDKVAQTEIIRTLFGVEQGSKALMLMEQLTGSADQMSRAWEVAAQTPSTWADAAEREIEDYQANVASRFKIALEKVRLQLIEFGTPFLEFGVTMLEGLEPILAWFQGLPEGVKSAGRVILVLTAMLGPMIMLAGLFANALGNVVKAGSSLFGLRNTFRIVTAEQQAASLMARQGANSMNTQSTAAAGLTGRINILTEAIRRQAAAAGAMGAGTPGNVAAAQTAATVARQQTATAPDRSPVGSYAFNSGSNRWHDTANQNRMVSSATVDAARQTAVATSQVAQQSGVAARNWGSVANGVSSAALGIGMIAAMNTSSNETATNFMQVAFGASLAMQFLPQLASGTLRMTANLGRAIPLTAGLTNGIGAALGKMNPLIAGALRFLGPVGIIAGGIVLLKEVYDYMTLISNRQKDINKSGEAWADILGYEYEANAFAVDDEDDTLDKAAKLDKITADLREKNKGLVDYTKNQLGNQEELLRVAKQQAALVAGSGGTRDQANLAAKSILMAAGVGEAEIKNLMVKVESINWENPEVLAAQMTNSVSKYIFRAQDMNDQGSRNIRDWFRDGTDLTQVAGEQATLAGQAFAEAFTATSNPKGRSRLFEQLDKDIEKPTKSIIDNLRNSSDEAKSFFEAKNIAGPQALLSTIIATQKAIAMGDEEGLDRLSHRGKLITEIISVTEEEMRVLRDAAGMEKTVTQAIVTNLGLEDDRAKNMVTLEGLQKHLGYTESQMAEEIKNVNKQLRDRGEATYVAAKGMEWLAGVDEEAAKKMLPDARRNVMQYATDFILDEAAYAHQNNFDAAMDAIRRRGEAEQAALQAEEDRMQARHQAQEKAQDAAHKAREDNVEAKYKRANRRLEESWDAENGVKNSRLRGIQEQIKAEEEAEKVRERIFEAEKRRIQRMADLFGRNVDFNVALNEGNLDEAAKIQSNTSAQLAGWSVEDQRDRDPVKTRLDTLKELEAAEEQALSRQKERETEALRAAEEKERATLEAAQATQQAMLRAAQERERAEVQAQRNASQERIRDREASAQRMFEIEKRRLDRELAILRQFIPTNEAELKNWEGRARAIYDQFGAGYLQPTSVVWGNLVGTGLENGVRSSTEAMKNEIQWAAVAADIASKITGVLGLTVGEFMTWMKTGTMPGAAPGQISPGGGSGSRWQQAVHVGGNIGWSSKDRTGVPRSASLYPSEVSAVLKRGEYVVEKKAAQKNLGILEQINSGKFSQEGIARHLGGRESIARHSGGQVSLGGSSMMTGLMAGVMRQVMTAVMGQVSSTVASNFTGSPAALNIMGEAAIGAILKGLRMQESSGNYKARSSISSASGAYQYIKSTWAGHGGYSEAWQAPPAVQDARASADLLRNFRKFGNWEQAIASHFYPAWAGNKAKWGNSPGVGNPTVWDYVNGVLSKSGMGTMTPGGGGLQGGAFSSAGQGWPPAVRGKVSANTAAAANYIRQKYGITSIGTLGDRPNKSDHPMGKAADFMIPKWNTAAGIALGNAISAFFVQNPNSFGTKYVIWRDKINSGSGWRPYTHPNGPTNNPTLQHRDHVHTSFKHEGGMIPQLATGGSILRDNVLANLHKGETVLTAPLTQDMKDQARGSGGNGDNFNITVNGTADEKTKTDFEKIVRKVLDDRDKRNGITRRVGK